MSHANLSAHDIYISFTSISRYPDEQATLIILSNEDNDDVWHLKDEIAELTLLLLGKT